MLIFFGLLQIISWEYISWLIMRLIILDCLKILKMNQILNGIIQQPILKKFEDDN